MAWVSRYRCTTKKSSSSGFGLQSGKLACAGVAASLEAASFSSTVVSETGEFRGACRFTEVGRKHPARDAAPPRRRANSTVQPQSSSFLNSCIPGISSATRPRRRRVGGDAEHFFLRSCEQVLQENRRIGTREKKKNRHDVKTQPAAALSLLVCRHGSSCCRRVVYPSVRERYPAYTG